jgi:hypothetical protein
MSPKRTGTNPVHITAFPADLLLYQRIARELRMTDQILSDDLDCVEIVEAGKAPAWTHPDGSRITINLARMPSLIKAKRSHVAVWLGTNAHELFHNHYTPRSNSPLMRRIQGAEKTYAHGIHRSWNVLEDQRIERLGLARYAAWRGYLIAALAYHIPVTNKGAWALVAGRTWLSVETRSIARATFVATNGEDAARTCAALIAAYQSLADPGWLDAEEAWTIVSQFHSLFGETLPRSAGCGTTVIEEGDPETPDPDEAQYPVAEDEPHDEPDEGDEGGEGEPGDDADEGDEGDADGAGEGDDADDTEVGDGDGDGDGEDEGDGEPGDGNGDGEPGDEDGGDGDGEAKTEKAGDSDKPGDGTSAEGGATRSIGDALNDDIDDALGEDLTSSDLDRVVDSIQHGHAGRGEPLPQKEGVWEEATPKARLLARDLSAVLTEIRDDCEAAWVRNTDSGRFSVHRWATDPAWTPDDVFDRFEPGAMDATTLDCYLALDVSGSMDPQNRRLAEATWAIRTGVDRVEGTCTCIGFGAAASMLFDVGRRPDGRMFLPFLEGSTNPTQACREIHRLVSESTATNRIAIVLTDGSWSGEAKALEAMRAVRTAGATTALIGLGRDTTTSIKAKAAFFDVTAVITDPAQLVPIFRQLAETSMLAAAGR